MAILERLFRDAGTCDGPDRLSSYGPAGSLVVVLLLASCADPVARDPESRGARTPTEAAESTGEADDEAADSGSHFVTVPGSAVPASVVATETPERSAEAATEPEAPAPALQATGGDKLHRDFGQDCSRSGCHAELRRGPVVHGPVSLGECGACHAPDGDAPEHRFRLTQPITGLCVSCHPRGEARGVVHEPFAELRCLDCHDPHKGNDAALLAADSMSELCARCHEPHEGEHLHGPFEKGACTACHDGHESDHENLLVLPGKDLCIGCHEDFKARAKSSPFVHGPVATDCGVCHTSHASDQPGLLRLEGTALCLGCHDAIQNKLTADTHVHGAIGAEPGCTGCHTPHFSESRTLLRSLASDLCLGCHDREIIDPETKKRTASMASVRTAEFLHGPVKEGDCRACHFSHSSNEEDLLNAAHPPRFYKEFSRETYGLCFRCHEAQAFESEQTSSLTSFRDGTRNLHYLHVVHEKGRTCRACHESHAGDLPHLLRQSVPFGSSSWMLPIEFESTDTGGKCSPGCHDTQTYDRTREAPPPGASTGVPRTDASGADSSRPADDGEPGPPARDTGAEEKPR